MSEAALWSTVRDHLRPFGRIERLENLLKEGVSDCVYGFRGHAGWLELKYLHRFPVRSATIVRCDHLTSAQVLWLEEWARHGIGAWCLLQVGAWYLLLCPVAVRRLYRRELTTRELLQAATVKGHKAFPTVEIMRVLMGRV